MNTAERVTKILEMLASDGPCGVTDLGRELGMGKNNVFKILADLEALGWVHQEIETKNQLIQEEIKAVKEEPVFVPPPIVQKTVPKVEGIKYQTRWDFEVVDIMALIKAVADGKLPKEALQANEKLIRQQVTSLKDSFNWPGIRTFKKIV